MSEAEELRLSGKIFKMEAVLQILRRWTPLHNDRDAYLHAVIDYGLDDGKPPKLSDYGLER